MLAKKTYVVLQDIAWYHCRIRAPAALGWVKNGSKAWKHCFFNAATMTSLQRQIVKVPAGGQWRRYNYPGGAVGSAVS